MKSQDPFIYMLAAFAVPTNLQDLGYLKMPRFQELARRAFERLDFSSVRFREPWIHWSGLGEYLGCVHMARENLKALPTGSDITYVHKIPAKYHSVSLVFFAQALLDNMAVWLTLFLGLPIKGGERQLLSTRFAKELRKMAPAAQQIVEQHRDFIEELDSYRQVWIHTFPGGAVLWGEEGAMPDASSAIGVPVDPALNPFGKSYQKRLQKCVDSHGRNLYSVSQFADRITEGVTQIFMEVLDFALDFRSGDKTSVTEDHPGQF
jgi:hypothetical protein